MTEVSKKTTSQEIYDVVVSMNEQIRSGRYEKVKRQVLMILTTKKSISNKKNKEQLQILLNNIRALEKNNSDMLGKTRKFAQTNGLSL